MPTQTTDRVAVLREVEKAVRKAAGNCGYRADDGCDFCNGVDAALDQVRRMADETQPAEEEANTGPLLFWNEAAGVTYQDGRITLHVDQAVNLAQAVPAGNLILQPSAAETLRKALTRALAEAHAPRCPHCGESLADYDTDAYVYRAGDERPYCSSECVVAAYRATGARQDGT